MRISLVLATCIVLTGFATQTAQASPPTDIQMLPPTILNSSPAVTCPPSLGTGHVLTWDGSNPISCDGGLTVDNTNKSVQIPLSSAAAGCDAAHAGSQRWNNVKTYMEVCNGTAWVPLGGNNCDGLGYAATAVSDPGGDVCAPVCPAFTMSGNEGWGFGNNCMGNPPNCNFNPIGNGSYSAPNSKIGDNYPPNPSLTNAFGTLNVSAVSGIGSGNIYYRTCTASGWSTIMLGTVY